MSDQIKPGWAPSNLTATPHDIDLRDGSGYLCGWVRVGDSGIDAWATDTNGVQYDHATFDDVEEAKSWVQTMCALNGWRLT